MQEFASNFFYFYERILHKNSLCLAVAVLIAEMCEIDIENEVLRVVVDRFLSYFIVLML